MKIVLGVVRPEMAMDFGSKEVEPKLMRGLAMDSPRTIFGGGNKERKKGRKKKKNEMRKTRKCKSIFFAFFFFFFSLCLEFIML